MRGWHLRVGISRQSACAPRIKPNFGSHLRWCGCRSWSEGLQPSGPSRLAPPVRRRRQKGCSEGR
eukprot:6399530-Alexandrium_andersonii.AAC.1